jgi:hypothetical protein
MCKSMHYTSMCKSMHRVCKSLGVIMDVLVPAAAPVSSANVCNAIDATAVHVYATPSSRLGIVFIRPRPLLPLQMVYSSPKSGVLHRERYKPRCSIQPSLSPEAHSNGTVQAHQSI